MRVVFEFVSHSIRMTINMSKMTSNQALVDKIAFYFSGEAHDLPLWADEIESVMLVPITSISKKAYVVLRVRHEEERGSELSFLGGRFKNVGVDSDRIYECGYRALRKDVDYEGTGEHYRQLIQRWIRDYGSAFGLINPVNESKGDPAVQVFVVVHVPLDVMTEIVPLAGEQLVWVPVEDITDGWTPDRDRLKVFDKKGAAVAEIRVRKHLEYVLPNPQFVSGLKRASAEVLKDK